MDLSVKLVLRAQAEGTSAIRAMKEETAELAAAMKEVRAAARSGGQVSPSSIKALGGFDKLQAAFAQAQKEMSGAAKNLRPSDEEKAFRARLRMTNAQAKVRLAESERVARTEAEETRSAALAERREIEETLRFRRSMWAQQGREAEAEARAEAQAVERSEAEQRRAAEETLQANLRYWAQRGRAARENEAAELRAATAAARQQRETLRGMGLGLIAGRGPEDERHGGRHGRGRGIMGELGLAAEYTLTYGAINQVLGGLSAVARSPFALGRMSLGVADQAKEIRESAAALGVSARDYQALRYSFAGKGLGEDRVEPMVQMAERSAVAAMRHVKSQTVAFQALHISMKQLKADSRDPMKLLTDISDAISKVKNPSAKTAIADIIFGRQGAKYMPVLDHGYMRQSGEEAQRSGAILSDRDLAAGTQAAEQWRALKLEAAGIKNETAAAVFPLLSQVFGDANSWLRQHRSEISDIIKNDVKELRDDLPTIEKGMTNIANSALAFARDLAPALHAVTEFAKSPIAKFMMSGQVYPGSVDLSDPKARGALAHSAGHNPSNLPGEYNLLHDLLDKVARAAAEATVHIRVQADPGLKVSSMTTRGVTHAHRGGVHTGG